MIIRPTTAADLDAAEKIYADARTFMRAAGNPTQWLVGGPSRATLLEDIERGGSYVVEEDGEILAVFYFKREKDPTYTEIHEGRWLDGEEYAVIHRIAVADSARGRGVASFVFSECFKMHPNLKIDTHRDNIPMQRALYRSGFVRCGIIYLENGEERFAFQKNS
ncbi:MAG: GNAT family N-acetyltransferase [Clostridia bacterium]|nr:GNAT family N-acetyltransferase [Clostridia bacterium]